jgi:predicted nucleic acid-binding protein
VKTLVIDASVAGAWMLPDEASKHSDALLRDIAGGKVTAKVPTLWWYECANLARSAGLRKRLADSDARLALAALRRLPITTLPWVGETGLEILDRSLRYGLSAYDATYFHAAEAEPCDLCTLDGDLLALRPQFPWIRSLQDYRSPR